MAIVPDTLLETVILVILLDARRVCGVLDASHAPSRESRLPQVPLAARPGLRETRKLKRLLSSDSGIVAAIVPSQTAILFCKEVYGVRLFQADLDESLGASTGSTSVSAGFCAADGRSPLASLPLLRSQCCGHLVNSPAS